jgi:PAS domain S-box-containing protein
MQVDKNISMMSLLHTEFDFTTFFDLSPDLLCIVGRDGYFKRVNAAVINKSGYDAMELLERQALSFVHIEDKKKSQLKMWELLDGNPLENFVNRCIKKDGEVVWLEWTAVYSPADEAIFAIAKDVTERIQSEKDLEEKFTKFKSLTTHFKSTIEKDKKNMAYELHEELAQLVAAVKMDIGWISNHTVGLTQSSKDRIEHALTVSKMLVKSIQRISFSISPNLLDEFGLNTTLEWLCNEFFILNNIPCYFSGLHNEQALTYEMKIDFFRICQEALTNILNHAQAKHVTINIRESDDHIELSITDDGKGFDTSLQPEGAGLQNMQRRAVSINAELIVTSQPAKGTVVLVKVPKTVTA